MEILFALMASGAIHITAQVLGVVGSCVDIASYQNNDHKKIMICKTLAEILTGVGYLLKGGYTAVAMNTIGSVRNIVFADKVKKEKNTLPWIIGFSVVTVLLGILTWGGPVSLLAIAGKLITTVAFGMKKCNFVRLLSLPSAICWIVYDILVGAYGAILSSAFSSCSAIVGCIRFRGKEKAELQSEEKNN